MPETKKTEEKRTAAQIVIESFLKDVDERGTMPWQRPYERYESFNYFSKKAYRGINRLILPSGEYITRKQINDYNKQHGEDFRFQKGIEWFPVVFFKPDVRKISQDEFSSMFPDVSPDENFYKFKDGWIYAVQGGQLVKRRNILRYYMVAERHHFKNSKGEMLPSRIESGEVVITKSNPKTVWNDYIARTGIVVRETIGTPCYSPAEDVIELNRYTSSEDAWFSIAFHEAGHSTGHKSRLNRRGVASIIMPGSDVYAEEECIAEICAFLCCAETGITNMKTSGTAEYDNSIAYVQAWKKRVRDWGSSFIYIVSQADKAFNYICGNPDGGVESAEAEE